MTYKDIIKSIDPDTLMENFRFQDMHSYAFDNVIVVENLKPIGILTSLRNTDIVYRWGGEEFVALLPTASLDIAKVIADKAL